MSQPALGAELLSQAFDLASTEPPSADPRKEPILVEITNTSTTVENVSFIFDAYWGFFFNFFHLVFYPSSDFLLRQILPEETSMQDREPDSPLNDPVDVEGGLVAVNTQTAQSGKQLMVRELFAQFISPQQTWTENLPMLADADFEISELIQLDISGVSSAVPSLQIEATTKKVLYLILLVHSIINWSDPSNQDFHYT